MEPAGVCRGEDCIHPDALAASISILADVIAVMFVLKAVVPCRWKNGGGFHQIRAKNSRGWRKT